MQAHVLIAEDEPALLATLSYNLEAGGFRVTQVDDGGEVMMHLDEELPDLVILDWMMPLLSGIEVCRQLKTRDDTKHIPVIMLSARSEEVDAVRGLDHPKLVGPKPGGDHADGSHTPKV